MKWSFGMIMFCLCLCSCENHPSVHAVESKGFRSYNLSWNRDSDYLVGMNSFEWDFGEVGRKVHWSGVGGTLSLHGFFRARSLINGYFHEKNIGALPNSITLLGFDIYLKVGIVFWFHDDSLTDASKLSKYLSCYKLDSVTLFVEGCSSSL